VILFQRVVLVEIALLEDEDVVLETILHLLIDVEVIDPRLHLLEQSVAVFLLIL
jgi:hypothetical protein